jgi:hypothetical protein
MYQLEPGEGVSLSDHVGHQVRITGSLTPARRDAQEVVVQKETVGAQELPSGDTLITDKVTITRYELASAAQLKVTSLDHVSETCDANP